MLVGRDMVGIAIVGSEFVFAEERKNLFPISLTGATIQDGSPRERRELLFYTFASYIFQDKIKYKIYLAYL